MYKSLLTHRKCIMLVVLMDYTYLLVFSTCFSLNLGYTHEHIASPPKPTIPSSQAFTHTSAKASYLLSVRFIKQSHTNCIPSSS